MSVGAVATVALGLVLLYSLLGILASSVQELVTGALGTRAKSLAARLRHLLADDNTITELPKNDLARAWRVVLWGKPSNSELSPLLKEVLNSGIISASSGGKPSYISSGVFAQSVVAALQSIHDKLHLGKSTLPEQVKAAIERLTDGGAKSALSAFLSQSNDDISEFKKSVASWFDESMDRLNGIYTRWSRLFALLFGLIVAASLNVDTLSIVRTIYRMAPEQRTALESIAAKINEEHAEAAKDNKELTAERVQAIIAELALPIGWPDGTSLLQWKAGAPSWPNGWSSLLGWIITAVAVSLGSQFWFDLLAKFVSVRNSGPKPEKTTEKKQDE